ncbi:hypothetical protein BD413DRAFT_222549 [Trametes elegans]|nr:hypothetical protein BD413DRAFT_222549 [Trametes elegans]
MPARRPRPHLRPMSACPVAVRPSDPVLLDWLSGRCHVLSASSPAPACRASQGPFGTERVAGGLPVANALPTGAPCTLHQTLVSPIPYDRSSPLSSPETSATIDLCFPRICDM